MSSTAIGHSVAGEAQHKRLDLMRRAGLLERHEDDALDQLAELTRQLLGVDTALVSLVGEDRQVFRGAAGLRPELIESRRTDLDRSYCKFPVATGEPLVVPDARKSALLRDSPAITELDAISYAGVPLQVADGTVLGTLCVLHSSPREWSVSELDRLGRLADLARSELERQLQQLKVHDLMVVAERLEEPVAKLGHTVRTVASLAEKPDDARLPRVADIAMERLRGVEALAEDLISMVRRERVSADPVCEVDVVDEVQRVMALAGSVARHGDLSSDLPERPVMVEAKARALSRALANAVTTVLHHVSDDRVTVTVKEPSTPDDQVAVTVAADHTLLPAGDLLRVAGLLSAVHGDEAALDVRYAVGEVVARSAMVRAAAESRGTRIQLRLDPVCVR